MDQEQQRDYAEEAAAERDARDESTREARALSVGDVIIMSRHPGGPAPDKVSYTQHNADGTVTVVLASGLSTLAGPDNRFDIGTEADLQAAADREFRRKVAHQLAHLAELIITADLPLGNRPEFSTGVLEDETELQRWADLLGAVIEDGGTSGLIPVVRADGARDGYLYPLTFHAQATPPITQFPVPLDQLDTP